MREAIRVERRVDAPPETVYRYIVDPELRARWFGVSSQFGASGELFEMHSPNGMTASGEVVTVTDSKVSFTWGWEGHPGVPPGSSLVEIELLPDGDGTLVVLTHTGLAIDEQPLHRQGWTHYLGRLQMSAEGGDPGPDPGAG